MSVLILNGILRATRTACTARVPLRHQLRQSNSGNISFVKGIGGLYKREMKVFCTTVFCFPSCSPSESSTFRNFNLIKSNNARRIFLYVLPGYKPFPFLRLFPLTNSGCVIPRVEFTRISVC